MARPVEFDREEVLDQIMSTFWEKGYCATRISDLVRATRLKPGSIYAAFKSKEGLFLAAIDHYGKRSVARVRQALEGEENPLDGIEKVLEQLVVETDADIRQRGCLLVNTALEVAPHNEAVRERVSLYLDSIEQCFLEALQSARESGYLGKDQEPASLAKYLMINIWGIRVLQRISTDKSSTRELTQQYMRLLKA